MIYITVCLFVLIIAQGLQSFFERRRYLKLIDQLTDKVMSRDYRDYVWGQEMKKEEPPKPATYRSRSDVIEKAIEEENKKAEELLKTAEGLAKRLEPTG